MTAPDDRILLSQIAEGKQEALEQLYATYRVRLWRYLWYRLGENAQWTEDVLQEVLLAIWHAAGSYRGEAQVETWILRIVHNIAANALRTQSRRVEGYLASREEMAHMQLQGSTSPHTHSEEQILDRLLLTEALHRLSQKHREVLVLVFYYGFTCDEVASLLSIPTGTVKSRMSYARQKLLEDLLTARAPGGN